uniref:Ubiquitin carboxyl-terminal hydrolase MINDY n=1 Tax=Zosterops lateralis melanops TaxID=1220523 RepID=A0A8D2NM68_ZOSLA
MCTRLQELLFRNSPPVFSREWAAAHFSFHPPHSDLAYGLEIGQVKGSHSGWHWLPGVTDTCGSLCPLEQGQALATALAETLWAAGGGGRAVVCLVTAPVTTVPHEGYRASSFTERVLLFEFSGKAAAQGFISDHINSFKGKGGHGVILFLYSLLFSRTLERLQEDLGDTAPLLNVSSGNVTCTEVGHVSGILLLVLPHLPFRVALGFKGGFFRHLFFASFSDTHSHPWEEARGEGPGQRRPGLEMAIRTRWAGATVSWDGTEPLCRGTEPLC